MTTYRVGAAGATVFDTEGRLVARLEPGHVVVEGTIETGADQPKGRRSYLDKMLRPRRELRPGRAYEDKARG